MASQYNVKVSGVEEYKGKPTIKCAAPWGGSYPLVIYLKEDEAHLADDIKRGDTITIVKGNLKDGKDANKEYNFYWNLAPKSQAAGGTQPPLQSSAATKLTSTNAASSPAAGSVPQGAPPASDKQGTSTRTDAYVDTKQFRTAIEMTRRDALEFAVHLWGTGAPEEDVMGTAERFVGWLETGKRVLNPNADDEQVPF